MKLYIYYIIINKVVQRKKNESTKSAKSFESNKLKKDNTKYYRIDYSRLNYNIK